jgi:hypothetical protein
MAAVAAQIFPLHKTTMLTIDTSDFTKATAAIARLAQDPMLFALLRLCNGGLKAKRKEIITSTWPTHVHVTNLSFIRWALNSQFATKHSLLSRSPTRKRKAVATWACMILAASRRHASFRRYPVGTFGRTSVPPNQLARVARLIQKG